MQSPLCDSIIPNKLIMKFFVALRTDFGTVVKSSDLNKLMITAGPLNAY